ncbi:MAG: TAT-variant-translocated molybdopterin oxidoreductase [Pirellulaceae bacterium]|nr:TAT-variant-translocated molybdopterin oxidoreductase [Pirellulaceae bacterium]
MSANKTYWRSLNDLHETPEFEEIASREFPQAASEFPEGVSRRKWLKLMSSSLALGGFAGCRYGPDEIAAFVVRPPNDVAGVPKHYATNFELAGRACHLLVSNMDGRPIKIEGNPQHPVMRASEPNELGEAGDKSRFASAGSDIFAQACVLGLYDSDRASRVAKRTDDKLEASTWEDFAAYAKAQLEKLKANGGENHAILMSPSLSPAVNRWVAETVKLLPKTTVAQYSSIDASAQSQACEQAAGKPAELIYKLDAAQVICAIDCDLLGNDPNMVVYTRQFSKGRVPEPSKMNRLYAVESRFSVTGTAADSRLAVRSSQIGAFLLRVSKKVDDLLKNFQPTLAAEGEEPFEKISSEEKINRFVDAMAEDLVKHKGAGVVAVGPHQPLEVQLLALKLNQKLENFGKTVMLMPSRSAIEGVKPVSLVDLVSKLDAGSVNSVWILGDNPVYAAPGDVALGASLKKLENTVYLAEFEDETAQVSGWSVPLAHQLESWGDVLAIDGTYGISQPQILPLLGGKAAIDIMAMLHGEEVSAESSEQLIRKVTDAVAGKPLTSRQWREVLHSGFLVGLKSEPLAGPFNVDGADPTGSIDLDTIDQGSLELLLNVSDSLYDGRFAKNVWLQELPQSVTKICWDNAALVSPKTAETLSLKQGEMVRLVHSGKSLDLPVFVMPGQANGAISVQLGYGRICRDEAVSSNAETVIGQDAAPLRSFKAMHLVSSIEAKPLPRPYKLATTQDHFSIDELGLEETKIRAKRLIREGTLEQIQEGGSDFVEHLGTHHPPLESMWKEPMATFKTDETVNHQWGMTVDLNKCTGCNACVLACQAENNVPVVGKEQVTRGRELHWLRIDRYFSGDVDTPKIVNQPVACVHCETAPCEQVCPVAATVHTEEGINAMAYNRCIGTRYCANNCPYKVRRFNYFNYQTEYGYFYGWGRKGELETASRKLQQLVLNPEVTVRGRGVMEKCTYCIQKIQNGKIQARTENRNLEDGEIQTACQMACPSQAIVFGDLNDPNSRVSKIQKSERAYEMLSELNIKARTLYLARVRNTHQRLKTSDQLEVAHHEHGDHSEPHVESGEAHVNHS